MSIVKAIHAYIVQAIVDIKSVQFSCFKMALIQIYEIIWVGVNDYDDDDGRFIYMQLI